MSNGNDPTQNVVLARPPAKKLAAPIPRRSYWRRRRKITSLVKSTGCSSQSLLPERMTQVSLAGEPMTPSHIPCQNDMGICIHQTKPAPKEQCGSERVVTVLPVLVSVRPSRYDGSRTVPVGHYVLQFGVYSLWGPEKRRGAVLDACICI